MNIPTIIRGETVEMITHALKGSWKSASESLHVQAIRVEIPVSNFPARHLQSTTASATPGRTVLTVLYLIILSLCFLCPCFYYFRMHLEERRRINQRVGEMANANGAEEGVAETELDRAARRARRKLYKEFKRAQIQQLFVPVRVKLTKEHFPHLRDQAEGEAKTPEEVRDVEMGLGRKLSFPDTEVSSTPSSDDNDATPEKGKQSIDTLKSKDDDSDSNADDYEVYDDVYLDETTFIEIPMPGVRLDIESSDSVSPRTHLVPNLCAICLSNYEIADDVVWSSNPECSHAFHEQCIENWLMKEKGQLLCPCCRRDFVVDPYDSTGHDGTSLILSPETLFDNQRRPAAGSGAAPSRTSTEHEA